MNAQTDQAENAIFTYAYGMDTGDWPLAVSCMANEVDVDYTAVGMPGGRMSRQQLATFLEGLLGKPELKVHTSVSQVLPHPVNPSEFVAYYSVRHFKGEIGKADRFFVFGWYSFVMNGEQIVSLKINVSAMEGEPGVLA